MAYVLHVHENFFEIVFKWTTFGLSFWKLIFETCHIMSLQVFSRKLAPKDRIWCFKVEFWAWGSNLEIPDFGLTLERETPRLSVHTEFMQSARAVKATLEREMCVSSTLHVFTVRLSGGMHARARTCVSRSSGGRAPVDREFHAARTFAVRSSGVSHAWAGSFCLHVRSSGESHARAWTPVSTNFDKCF